jgi:hypothetical protein
LMNDGLWSGSARWGCVSVTAEGAGAALDMWEARRQGWTSPMVYRVSSESEGCRSGTAWWTEDNIGS